MNILSTHQLTHRFANGETALSQLNLEVPEAAIYGFLGPNGAGKTTTLRLVLGLLRKQEGSIHVFEKPFHENRLEILQKIGSLIETPSLYGHLTALENLAVWRHIYQCPKERMKQVLELVDLGGTGNKKASQFSLGMKQRLSIAIALLNNPRFLVLDEPTNGLDPNGIIEMRELLRKLNREQGITILVSSHLLSEIEKLVTHVGIINKGKLLFQGTLNELISKQKQSSQLSIETGDQERALRIIKTHIASATLEEDRIVMEPLAKEAIAQLNALLVHEGVDVYSIGTVKNDLESVFIHLIK